MQDSFILEGKKYISAKRASEISDYSSDYIGQLCRAGKLDCRRIGRSWFVTEASIHLHRAAILEDEIHRNRIQNLRGGHHEGVAHETKKVVVPAAEISSIPAVSIPVPVPTESHTPTASQGTESIFSSPVAYSGLKYESDERPLIPVLLTGSEDEPVSETRSSHILSIDRSASTGVEPNIQSVDVQTYPELARTVVLGRVLRGATIVMIAFFMVGVAYVSLSPFGMNMSNSGETAQAGSAITSIMSAIRDSYMSILALFDHSPAVTMNVSNTNPQTSSGMTEAASDVPARGIAVAPSTGSAAGDTAVKQEIQNSFSDQVEITPDSGGTTGVITPVFKDAKGKNFVYVMVPVSNATTTIIR